MDFQLDISNPGTSWRSRSKGSASCETRSRQKRTQTSTIVSRPRRRVLLLARVREKSGFCDLGFLVARANVIVASVINQAIQRSESETVEYTYPTGVLLSLPRMGATDSGRCSSYRVVGLIDLFFHRKNSKEALTNV